MKSVIMRTPETDRKLVTIPTLLTDLTDYDDTIATGLGTSTNQTIEILTTANATLGTTTGLRNVTGPGLTVEVAGLFLCILTVHWSWAAAGAPNLSRRVGLSKNGAASFEASVQYNFDATGAQEFDDQASFLVRLAVGDSLQPRIQDLTGTAADVTTELSIVKVAP